MPCYSPKGAYYSKKLTNKGLRKLVFDPRQAVGDGLVSIKIPCGRCIGCRLSYADDWATRCMLERSTSDEGVFLTLTYAPEHLPRDMSLNHKHFQAFMKRLRKRKYLDKGLKGTEFEFDYMFDLCPNPVSFLMCGEYGDQFLRPHYHAVIFGINVPDLELLFTRGGHKVYTSEILKDVWGKGHVSIGSVTWQSARYVARYITKKVFGDSSKEHYSRICDQTGEVYQVKPEYSQSSRRNVLGKKFYQSFASDMYPSDFVTIQGVKRRIPRYFDKLLAIDNPSLLESVKQARKVKARNASDDYTDERLAIKEELKYRDFEKFVRELPGV